MMKAITFHKRTLRQAQGACYSMNNKVILSLSKDDFAVEYILLNG